MSEYLLLLNMFYIQINFSLREGIVNIETKKVYY